MRRATTGAPGAFRSVTGVALVAAWAASASAPGAVLSGPDLAFAQEPDPAGAAGVADTLLSHARLTWQPGRPTQGALLVLRVAPAAGSRLVTASGRAGGEELHFYPEEGGTLESLAPVPVDASDSMQVELTLEDDQGATRALTVFVPVVAGSYHHEELTVAPELGSPLSEKNRARLASDQAKAAAVSRASRQTERLWTRRVVLPRDDRVTGRFGDGRIFNGQVSSRHMGLDLHGATGDTVVAAARGVVALVDHFLLAGNIVYVNHGAGLISGYFHLSRQLVQEGDTVEAGTPIGLVGATGRVTGPHLHWVVRYGTTSVDPRSLVHALAPGR